MQGRRGGGVTSSPEPSTRAQAARDGGARGRCLGHRVRSRPRGEVEEKQRMIRGRAMSGRADGEGRGDNDGEAISERTMGRSRHRSFLPSSSSIPTPGSCSSALQAPRTPSSSSWLNPPTISTPIDPLRWDRRPAGSSFMPPPFHPPAQLIHRPPRFTEASSAPGQRQRLAPPWSSSRAPRPWGPRRARGPGARPRRCSSSCRSAPRARAPRAAGECVRGRRTGPVGYHGEKVRADGGEERGWAG